MIEQESIDYLRDYHTPDMGVNPNIPSVGLAVYVKGHTSPNDGGGGIFLWSRSINYLSIQDNDGTVINPRNTNPYYNQGRWVRQIEGSINVRYFGAIGIIAPSIDDTFKIQSAIDFAAQNFFSTATRGNVVYLPNGHYNVSKLIMKNGVTLKGDSSFTTYIKNFETEEDPQEYLIEMEPGPVQIKIEGLTFEGARSIDDKSNKGCLHFHARTLNLKSGGGLWNSNFKDISIIGFNGHSIYLEGGETKDNFKLVNQFCVFENVRAVRNGLRDKNSLRITGSTGQFTFINCTFDAKTRIWEGVEENVLSGINVYIKGFENYHYPSIQQFLTCTFQLSEYAIYIDTADSISFESCWFERNEVSLNIINSRSINILNSRFADGSSATETIPPGTGRCISSKNSQINVKNNFVVSPTKGAVTFLAVDSPERIGTNVSGNYFERNDLGFTYGVLSDPGVINGIDHNISVITTSTLYYKQPQIGGLIFYIRNFIDLKGNSSAYIKGSTDIIKVITSSVNSGNYIYIRAKNQPIVLDNTGNIFLSFKNSIEIKPGECALFIRVDTFVINPNLNPNENFNIGVEFRENYNLISLVKES